MVISNQELIKKLEKRNAKCKRCKNFITTYDIMNNNVVYNESKVSGKNWYHKECINEY